MKGWYNMLKFEKDVPDRFRKCDTNTIVRTVGELIDELSHLPRDLPMEGDFGNGKCVVGVIKHIRGGSSKLVCTVEDREDDFQDDEDDFDEDYDDGWEEE